MSISSEYLLRILDRARKEIETRKYQTKFIAMNQHGESCSPKQRGAALSFHGAIICACRSIPDRTAVFAWLSDHGLIPRSQPRSKESCLALFSEAIAIAKREHAQLELIL